MKIEYSEQYESNGIIVEGFEDFQDIILDTFYESDAVVHGLEGTDEDYFVVQLPGRPNFEVYTEKALLASIRSLLKETEKA